METPTTQAQETPFLTDEQLAEQGMVKITAFIRTEQSEAAARKKRQREKEESNGLKQLNVKAPIEAHDTLKKIAGICAEGKTVQEAINALTPKEEIKTVTSHKLVTKGWKKWLINLLMKLCKTLEN